MSNTTPQLANKLEKDHYETAVDYFTQHGVSDVIIKTCKVFFDDYDALKPAVVEDMKKAELSEDYIKAAEALTTERALEIIDLAVVTAKSQGATEEAPEKSGDTWNVKQ
jgi:hypothetical protein